MTVERHRDINYATDTQFTAENCSREYIVDKKNKLDGITSAPRRGRESRHRVVQLNSCKVNQKPRICRPIDNQSHHFSRINSNSTRAEKKPRLHGLLQRR